MPERDVAPIGAPCWVDLSTSNPDVSRDFYTRLFGWTIDDPGPEFGGYVNFQKDGRQVAGCMRNASEGAIPDAWSVYLATPDANATAAAVVAHGGQMIVEPMPVATLGTMAVAVDAGGAVIGMWQPGDHKGFGLLAEPNAPGWFELFTRDYDASVAFYRDVFKWDPHTAGDAPDFRYTTLGKDESATAGIMDASGFLPAGVPAHWSVYFQVSDADGTVATAEELGAKVMAAAEDTPYGRLATLVDPTGAAFKLLGR